MDDRFPVERHAGVLTLEQLLNFRIERFAADPHARRGSVPVENARTARFASTRRRVDQENVL